MMNRAWRYVVAVLCAAMTLAALPARAADTVLFSAKDNVINALVARINAETVRIDMSCWYLTERAISQALVNRFNAGVKVRLIGDRGSIFEIDPNTRNEFYWVASQGIPIRLRYNPTWFPEIDHWKATIFVGQNVVAFGSANYTTFELAPWSSTNYQDEITLFTDDQPIVKAFKTKFDRFWNDTVSEPESMIPSPPYFMNWDKACAMESACSDYRTQYPNPKPMVIDTSRLEPDNPLPADMVWGQGPDFNDRLTAEINKEPTAVDFVIYRLTVSNITDALIAKFKSGVPVRLIVEPNEYLNDKWPEFWITHAMLDKLWAAGIPMKQRVHAGLTHMKVLLTSTIGTIASSNYTAGWQRDADYFLPAATKPAIHQAMKAQFQSMWNNTTDFTTFNPLPPNDASLSAPSNGATGVSTTTTLVWNRAAFATDYDVMLGPASGSMVKVGNVKADLSNDPPQTYSWTPSSPLLAGTTYNWQIVSRTNATPVKPSVATGSNIRSFTTAGTAGGPSAPNSPSPSNGATNVALSPTLTWSGAAGATFNVAFGTSNPPPQVATGLSTMSYQPGTLSANKTYFWRVTAVSSGGSAQSSVWSFVTGSGSGQPPGEVVIYASDVTKMVGAWSTVSDSSAAGGMKLRNADNGVSVTDPVANPADYFEATFNAQAGTRYRVWFRIHPIADSKFNDSFFVQFSDSVDGNGNAVYRTGTPGGYVVNLWTCSTCQTSGWGWQRNAYWLPDSGDVWFPTTGTHTIRVQTREDGAEIDQIVISPATYANSAPGGTSNDTTIVPKPSGGGGPQLPGAPGSPSPANNATGASTTNTTLTWSASGATSYDVRFGTSNPPSQVVSNQSAASYTPTSLAASTSYFWQIVARNSAGTTTGPVWTFKTAASGGGGTAPSAPGSPSPANNASGVSATNTTLTWSASGATSYDVRFGTSNPPVQVASNQTAASYAPSGLTTSTTYFWQIVARNSVGTTTGPLWTFTTSAGSSSPSNIVIDANDVPSANLKGAWSTASDSTSPGSVKLVTSNTGYAQTNAPLASPVHYFDVSFNATANTPYHIWLRLQALNNDKFNDAVWVQFSDARSGGSSIYAIGSTSALLVNLATDSSAVSLDGWGWQDGAYWLSQPTTVTFPTTGTHTLRIQVREDGVQLDQIVLSPSTYLTNPPGPATRDNTIVVP